MPGCKQGDLVKFRAGEKNAGRLATILCQVGICRDLNPAYNGDIEWLIQPLQPLYRKRWGGWILSNDMTPGHCVDQILIPIRPGDLDHVDWRDKTISPEKELARELDKWARANAGY